MNKQYRLRIDVINLIIRFIICFSITSFILFSAMKHDSYVWECLLLLPAAIISFSIRRYSKTLWSFIILHLALLAAYIFLTEDIVFRVAYGINILVFAITELVLDINKKIKNTPLVFSIVLIAIYMLCQYFYPETIILDFFFSFTIAFGLLYILNMYYVNSYIYFKNYEDIRNIPMKKIQSINIFYIGGFLLLSFIVMILFTRIPLGGLGQLFRLLLIKFIKFLISSYMLVLKKPEEITLEEEVTDSIRPFENPEQSLLSEIATLVFGAITLIAIVVFIIYGLYRVYKHFYSRAVFIEQEMVKTGTQFVKDGKSKGKKTPLRRGALLFFGRSNNIKIRKQYVKSLQKNTQSGMALRYKTPKELSEYAMEQGGHNMDELLIQRAELTAVYEKARYSNLECSKEEVKLVKDILSK